MANVNQNGQGPGGADPGSIGPGNLNPGRISRDTLISIVLLVFCGFLIWAGFQIRDPQFGELSPAAWPKAVSYVLTFFCLLYFLQSITSANRAGAAGVADNKEAIVDEHGNPYRGVTGFFRKFLNPILCFVLYFLFLITLPWTGTLIGGILLVFLLLSVLGGVSPRQIVLHLVIAGIAVGAMWALFTYGLGVMLPRGLLIPSI